MTHATVEEKPYADETRVKRFLELIILGSLWSGTSLAFAASGCGASDGEPHLCTGVVQTLTLEADGSLDSMQLETKLAITATNGDISQCFIAPATTGDPENLVLQDPHPG
jgi:hypothetical protein